MDYPQILLQTQKFYESINNEGTEIACQYATEIIFETGNHFSGTDVRDIDGIWVPGDWAYIRNKNYVRGKSTPGTNGENLIHSGTDGEGDKFWGHDSDDLINWTERHWFEEIRSWNNGSGKPEWDNQLKIRGPKIGLQ